MMRILLIKTSALGDIVHAFPVVEYLCTRFSHAIIDWVVEAPFQELVKANPHVHEVIPIDTKRWRKELFSRRVLNAWNDVAWRLKRVEYDLVIDLQGNSKSALFTYLANSQEKVGFGWKSVPEWPNLLATKMRFNPPIEHNIREDYLSLVKQYFNDTSSFRFSRTNLFLSDAQEKELVSVKAAYGALGGRKILISAGSAWKNKRLCEDSLKRVLAALAADSANTLLYIWGADEEKQQAEAMQSSFGGLILPRMSLPVLAHVMEEMNLILAMDSLPLHLAGLTPTPTLGFFGPSSGAKYAPSGENKTFIQGKCPYGRIFEKRCPILRSCPTGACMKDFNIQEILDCISSITND